METYRTEEEQVEAIRRWWDENGRSTIIAIVLALAAGFGWQAWQDSTRKSNEAASHDYLALLQQISIGNSAEGGDFSAAKKLAEAIKSAHSGTSYAQFAALELARLAVENSDLNEAQAQLRWVLGKAPAKSDIAVIAQLRLARVLAAAGDADQALEILAGGQGGDYAVSYAIAEGDIYLQQGLSDEARTAYTRAKTAMLGMGVSGSLATLEQKLQSLNPVPARTIGASGAGIGEGVEATVADPNEPHTTTVQEG